MRDDDIRLREMGHLNAQGRAKKAFTTKAAAKRAKKADGQHGADGLQPYVCHVCGNWHLGNRSPRGSV